MSETNLGTEQYQWDLRFLYKGIDDPQIDKDVEHIIEQYKKFNENYKGKLGDNLGLALNDYETISEFGTKFTYFNLQQSLNLSDSHVKAKSAEVNMKLTSASADYLSFFDIELVALDEAVLQKLYETNQTVLQYRPFIEYARVFKSHYLSEPVEAALTKRAPFGPGAWDEFFDEFESDLRIPHRGQEKTMEEAVKILSESKDSAERAEMLKTLNDILGSHFGKYAAQTLYMVTGAKSVETKERKYNHPMEGRNKGNRIPDEAVNMLHKAVTEIAGPLSQRYYRLKAKLLGVPVLKWSDRFAPVPFASDKKTEFAEALSLVINAYESFSPTLAQLIKQMTEQKRLDVSPAKNKRGGAFCMGLVLPEQKPVSFVFMSYFGNDRDIKTLAHELGHAVHFLLSGESQGALMYFPPMAYAETASVFGELTTFKFLEQKMRQGDDKKALAALLITTIEDILGTVTLQIAFSNFERRIHGMDSTFTTWSEPRKNSLEDLDKIWVEVMQNFYGKDGEIFTYENMEHGWARIPHFHNPFYVYSYAFGQLLSQSLYAQQNKFGDKFEPLYLDLLRSGASKDVIELLKPFDLDPTKEQFWIDGINAGLGAMIDELEKLIEEEGL